MPLLIRTPSSCAKTFNILTYVCLFGMVVGSTFGILHLNIAYLLPLGVVVALLIGLAFFQMGYSPIVAILLALSPSIPYVGSVVFLSVLVIIRYYLQHQNYTVSFLGAHIHPENPNPVTPIRWASCFAWLAVYVGLPLCLFLGTWFMNSEYVDKFFQPFNDEWWVGPGLLLTACIMSFLTLPLMIEIQRIRATQEKSISAICQIVVINALALVFCCISCGIVIFTPAAITMYEQMTRTN